VCGWGGVGSCWAERGEGSSCILLGFPLGLVLVDWESLTYWDIAQWWVPSIWGHLFSGGHRPVFKGELIFGVKHYDLSRIRVLGGGWVNGDWLRSLGGRIFQELRFALSSPAPASSSSWVVFSFLVTPVHLTWWGR
jgi:hypothetical protein